jgi:hypothetical protein
MVPAWCLRKMLVVICSGNALSSFCERKEHFANDECVPRSPANIGGIAIIRFDHD